MTGQEHLGFHQARSDQAVADGLTILRLHAAIPAGAITAITEPSIPTAAVHAGLWATDALDGRFAEKAQAAYPGLERTETSMRDPEADKRLFYGGLGGLMVRAVRSGDLETSVVVGTNMLVSALRDKAMERTRSLAETYRLPTDATTINKRKTQAHAVASVLLASPLIGHKSMRRASLAALSAGTAMGVFGQLAYRAQTRKAIRDMG